MDTKEANPAARMFGTQLQFLREKAGLTREALAAQIGNSPHTVQSWERGTRVPHVDTVLRLDEIYGTGGLLSAGAPQIKGVLLPEFDAFAEEEAGARSLYSFEAMTVPGLLQTPDYARAVIGAYCPPLDDEEFDRIVTQRLDRQALLVRRGPPAVLGFVIQEWVLRQPLGGRKVLLGQLGHLIEVAEMRNVTIQIMPTNTEQHTGTDGPLVLLETAKGRQLAYIEGQGRSFWVYDPDEVAVLTQRYGIIRAQALSTSESLERIKQIATGEL